MMCLASFKPTMPGLPLPPLWLRAFGGHQPR